MKLPFQLDRYTLVELIGAGAFGQVYRAEVRGDMGFVSDFAVKVLDTMVVASNPNVARQMADEARLLSQLDHPNIVKVIDFKHEDHDVLGDVYFMVMEFVRGVDVAEIIESANEGGRSIPATAVLHLGLMVADALAHAHHMVGRDGQQLQIVHRDLKPHNLMINFRGQVKVLDFGIAKAKDDRLAARTQEGQTKGTVFYMSPEQLTGDELDGRADIYSLASIMFELLLGRRLLDVEVSTPADLARAMHTAFEMDIDTRLQELRIHLDASHNGELPGEAVDGWIALLRAALQKDPRYRPDNAKVFSEQLEWLRARHPAASTRNFWAREASALREAHSGPQSHIIEEVPDVESGGLPLANDFFGLEGGGSVADEEVPAAAAARPDLPPEEVPVTRAMSVVSGTVRAFGSDAVRQLGGYQPLQPLGPMGARPPSMPDDEEEIDVDDNSLTATGDAPSVAQTLETAAHKPASSDVEDDPTEDGPAPEDERTLVYQAPKEPDPEDEQTVAFAKPAAVSAIKDPATRQFRRRPARRQGPSAKLLIVVGLLLLLLVSTLAVVIVARLSADPDGPGTTEATTAAVTRPTATKSTYVPTTPAPTPEVVEDVTATADEEPTTDPPAEPTVAEAEGVTEDAGSEPTATPEAVAVVETTPTPRPTTTPRATPRATPRVVASATPTPAAAEGEMGILYLAARPRCQVEVDGKSYGTTDETRRGVRLPEGKYRVRFVCDDDEDCAGFEKRSGVKTLLVEPGKETRYTADFFALNSRN